MKILFVISSLSSGGAERVVSILATELSERHNVTIVTFSDDSPFYQFSPRVRHRPLNLLGPSRNILERLLNSQRRVAILKSTFEEESPDIVISFMTQTNLLTILAARLAGKPVIVSERISYDFHSSGVLNLSRRLLYPLANSLVVQTKADASHYVWHRDVAVIPNPVSIPSEKVDFTRKEKIVLAVGRLVQQKGFDRLIKVFARLERNDWKLIIAGEGPERENLKKLIKSLDAKNVSLIGRQKDIASWYLRAAIFVLSSEREGFPNVLLEAMAHGCACIAFDCPYGPGEIIIDGKNGLLLPVDEREEKVASRLEALMENEERRVKLGEMAQSVRDLYAPQKIAERWERIFLEVVDGH